MANKQFQRTMFFYIFLMLIVLLMIGIFSPAHKPGPKQASEVNSSPRKEGDKDSKRLEKSFKAQAKNDAKIASWVTALRRLTRGNKDPWVVNALKLLDDGMVVTQTQVNKSGVPLPFSEGLPTKNPERAIIVLVDEGSLAAKNSGINFANVQGKIPALYNYHTQVLYLVNEQFDSWIKAVFLLHELYHVMEHRVGTLQLGDYSLLTQMRSEEGAYRITWEAVQFNTQGRYGQAIEKMIQADPDLLSKRDLSISELEKLSAIAGNGSLDQRITMLEHLIFVRCSPFWVKGINFHVAMKGVIQATHSHNIYSKDQSDEAFRLLDQIIEADRLWKSKSKQYRASALTLYLSATKLDPNYSHPWNILAIYYTEQFYAELKAFPDIDPLTERVELVKKMNEACQNWYTLRPETWTAYVYQAKALANSGQHEEALAVVLRGQMRFLAHQDELAKLEQALLKHRDQVKSQGPRK